MTRVAAGHPGIWPDICAENADAIVDALDLLIDGPRRPCGDRVADHDRDALLEILQRASAARRTFRRAPPDPEQLAEVRIPVPDRDGVLAEITVAGRRAGINIYDLEIAHSAEGHRAAS